MIAFARGACTGLRQVRIPASVNTVSHAAVNFVSRSRMRNFNALDARSRSTSRFRACWVTHALFGCAVAPKIRMRLLVCSITARTYAVAGVEKVDGEEVGSQNRVGLAPE